MLQHVLKRIGLFCFWFLLILGVLYLKSNFLNLSELLFEAILPTFLLLLMSAIFLLYESSDFKNKGKSNLGMANKILGIAILIVITITAFIFIRGAILID